MQLQAVFQITMHFLLSKRHAIPNSL